MILVILIYSLITLLKNDFDRYNVEVQLIKYQEKLSDINNFNDEELSDLWNSLNEDFTKLNQNYQDFLKSYIS